ncbi:MAG: class I SAM-dependent methyltransferase [Promethearchaeota archaeon]
MPDWNDIFNEKGKVFLKPHPDMKRLVKLFQDKQVKRILDLGCGTGRHIIFFLKNGFELYGIDAAPKGLEIAKMWLEEENQCAELLLHRIEEKLPFKDDFFDAIVSIQVIHHNFLDKIIITIKEIERVLRKGGIIFITFPTLKLFKHKDYWDLVEVEPRTFIPQNGQEKDLPHHFFKKSEIYKLFKNFEIQEMYIDKTNHRAILGIKK